MSVRRMSKIEVPSIGFARLENCSTPEAPRPKQQQCRFCMILGRPPPAPYVYSVLGGPFKELCTLVSKGHRASLKSISPWHLGGPLITAQMTCFTFLIEFSTPGSRGPWNPGFWVKMDPKWPKMLRAGVQEFRTCHGSALTKYEPVGMHRESVRGRLGSQTGPDFSQFL